MQFDLLQDILKITRMELLVTYWHYS